MDINYSRLSTEVVLLFELGENKVLFPLLRQGRTLSQLS
jgi:hypothetical protein